mmetsp:Transcript_19966/g.42622  ORF Transcript_19966/g.42622 Transcript_19966/m.42622 type:complete len:323 (+) Transcript_19966:50-1018(+)
MTLIAAAPAAPAARLLRRFAARALCTVTTRRPPVPVLGGFPAAGGLRWASEAADSEGGVGLSSTANSYISLGAFETMGGDVGRMATGISYLEETVRVQEAEYEAEADSRRRSMRGLGLANSLLQVGRQHHQQQDAQQAIDYYQRAMKLVEEAIDVRQQEVQETDAAKKGVEYARFLLTEVCCLAGVAYNDVGRQDEALEVLKKALTLRKAMVGKTHPSVAECLNNLGAIYLTRGSLQKAAEHYEQALELLTAARDGREEGAYVALTLYNIGVCRSRLGQMDAAGVALRRALKIGEQALGEDHRQVELIRETLKQGPMAGAQA